MTEVRSDAAGFNLERARAVAQRALAPLQPANAETRAPKDFFFSAKRLASSDALPPYYLVRFLLVDLLSFRDNGRFDKVAWSVPIDLDGQAFLIEHRKFGLGVFGAERPEGLEGAKAVARLLHRGVKASKPYFTWLAEEAGKASALNVVNRAPSPFGRFVFFADLFDARSAEAEARKNESIRTDTGPNSWTVHWPARELREEAIESFAHWIPALRQDEKQAHGVAKLAGWFVEICAGKSQTPEPPPCVCATLPLQRRRDNSTRQRDNIGGPRQPRIDPMSAWSEAHIQCVWKRTSPTSNATRLHTFSLRPPETS